MLPSAYGPARPAGNSQPQQLRELPFSEQDSADARVRHISRWGLSAWSPVPCRVTMALRRPNPSKHPAHRKSSLGRRRPLPASQPWAPVSAHPLWGWGWGKGSEGRVKAQVAFRSPSAREGTKWALTSCGGLSPPSSCEAGPQGDQAAGPHRRSIHVHEGEQECDRKEGAEEVGGGTGRVQL